MCYLHCPACALTGKFLETPPDQWQEGLLRTSCLEKQRPLSHPVTPSTSLRSYSWVRDFLSAADFRVSETSHLEVPQQAELQLDGQRDILVEVLRCVCRRNGCTDAELSCGNRLCPTDCTSATSAQGKQDGQSCSQSVFSWSAEHRGKRVLILFGSVVLHSILLFLSWLIPWLP